jgi:undecaprenyl-diphosphatase
MATFLQRLDARDRALFARWTLQRSHSARSKTLWVAVTHLGSAWCTIALSLASFVVDGPLQDAGAVPLIVLVASHLMIQGVKRSIARPRPSCSHVRASLIDEPDRFSFPSGHSAAAMAVALGFAYGFPDLAALLVMLAVLVGLSRVVLGVHFPGDVLVGQLIACVTAIAVFALL